MEEQLAAYRQRKNKEFKTESKSSSLRFWGKKESKVPSSDSSSEPSDVPPAPQPSAAPVGGSVRPQSPRYYDEAGTVGDGSSRTLYWVTVGLLGTLWLLVWGLFVELGFGAVFFVLSSLLAVYFNTRTGKDRGDGPSAYSVFNPNCERLDGTFTAEQFEKELRYGAGSVH